MAAPPEARSPFHLLEELGEARELLVLSYTTSLDFFERFALSHARALGAIVTVVSDAAMVSADPVVVRRAGAAYLDARAVCPGGAFHPKLFVLVGDGGARVGIGSGNLTMAGWHGNAELLTVLRADTQGGPRTIAEVAAFLRRLAASPIVFGPGAGEAFERVAGHLDELPANGPGPRLLDNLELPILDQLPATAEEVTFLAPYFDRPLEALEAVLDRLSPARASVLLESRTKVDGRRLSSLAAARGLELGWIGDEDRFHHGKLVEWSQGEQRWALTGSPNVSRSALLRPVTEGGNCELALLAEVDSPRAPSSTADHPEIGVLDLEMEQDGDEDEDGFVLLSATRVEAAVMIRLPAPLAAEGAVQRYDRESEGWTSVAELEPGLDVHAIAATLAPVGSALRIVLGDGAVSNQVFVTDLSRVRRPQIEAVGRRATPVEVAELGLGMELIADVEELRPHLLRAGVMVPVTSAGGDGDELGDDGALPRARPAPDRDLEDYLAACDPVLGREMTEFALALALPGLGGDYVESAAGLDADLDDDEAAEQSEEGDTSADADLNAVLASLPEVERRRWRRWVERLIDRCAGLPLIVRTLALRSLLHGIAAEVWEEEKAEELMIKVTAALGAGGDEPRPEELAAAGTLAAIATVWMREGVERLSVRDELALRYEMVAAAVEPLLPYREGEQIEALAPGMPPQSLGAGWVEACSEVATWILDPPRGPELAVRLLEEERDLEARIGADQSIELLDPVPARAEPRLCLALGLAGEDGPVLASGVVDGRTEAVAAWRPPLLAVERRTPTRRWGSLYRLPPTHTPLLYTGIEAELPAPIASWEGDDPRPPDAEELLG